MAEAAAARILLGTDHLLRRQDLSRRAPPVTRSFFLFVQHYVSSGAVGAPLSPFEMCDSERPNVSCVLTVTDSFVSFHIGSFERGFGLYLYHFLGGCHVIYLLESESSVQALTK